MADRHLPVRPNLEQLRHQAKDLLRAARRGESSALETLEEHARAGADAPKLADAQHALARSYGVASWKRLVQACRLIDAIWKDERETVRALVLEDPRLLAEDARGVEGNWGPPMSYAANVGRSELVSMLRDLGAEDLQHAFDRACLQGRVDTARALHAMGARPEPGAVMGPAETLRPEGLAYLLALGAPIEDEGGDPWGPIALVLETYTRAPQGKGRCLELLLEHGAPRGIELPDTPTMAVHRGRVDLLEAHLARDPELLGRRFSHREIYPTEVGCHEDESLALHGTPLAGTTLLHLAVDFAELDLARWLLERGADPNATAEVDDAGFGGHSALFGCAVSQPHRVGWRGHERFAHLLLDAGADPNARASLRKRLRFVADERLHEYRDVTPLSWGRRFHDQDWVNPAALAAISERGGGE